MTNRVAFLIDGFNVYYSIKTALAKNLVKHAKWLDYKSFCTSLLTDVTHLQNCNLASIHYFSAIAQHFSDKTIAQRHRTFIKALEANDVNVILANFKQKNVQCRAKCKQTYTTSEEKETDVNIAIHLLKLFMKNECDTAIILTGDTDLVAAVAMAKELFSEKRVGIGFPYMRSNNHFKQVADFVFKLKAERYELYQMSNSITLKDGTIVKKPNDW